MPDALEADHLTFERNMAALAMVAPELHDRMASFKDARGQIVPHPSGMGKDINLELDGRLLYEGEGGARTQSRRQVETFLLDPQRLAYRPPPLAVATGDVTSALRDQVDAYVVGLAPAARLSANRAGAMIVFGIGLGYHIAELFERVEFRHLALIEPHVELLWHSLWLQDWAGWLNRLAERDGSIIFLLGDDPETTTQRLHYYLRSKSFGTVSGSYLYWHYEHEALHAVLKEVARRYTASPLGSRGFFEDEVTMFVNSTRNLAAGPIRLVVNNPLAAADVPAIVVGAGPSLDKALPHLARLRNQCVVFSAGSTLRSLLRNGIVPDFQCEIENTAENYALLESLAVDHDLSEIALLASATVDARMPPLFRRRFLYLRDATLAAAVHGDPRRNFAPSTPNCLALALRAAVEFGFRQVYLFGADFGCRVPGRHHATDSVYMTDPTWAEKYNSAAGPMDLIVPANFGGKVHTDYLLHEYLVRTAELIHSVNWVAFFNCSDGAKLQGAVAKLPAQVKLAALPGQRQAALDAIEAGVERLPAGGLIDPARIRRFQSGCRTWRDELRASFTAIVERGGDLIDWHDAIVASRDRWRQRDDAVRTITEGSMFLMFHYAFAHALTYDLIADREFLMRVGAGFRTAMDDMVAQVDRMVDTELAACAAVIGAEAPE